MTFRKISLAFLIITLSVASAHAKKKEPRYAQAHQLTQDQAALVERAIGREKVLIKNIQQRTPLVETYIQNTRPDVKLYQVPVSDEYMLSRIDFGKGFFDRSYQPRQSGKHGFFKGSIAAVTGLTKALGLDKNGTSNPLGFTEMMFLDPKSFDNQHYVFSYVRREFLGSVRTWVYDVHPKVAGMGRFFGRIWIEDEDGNIVRFNGTYTGPKSEDDSRFYYHFDSWRMNVQPGIWLPVAVYVEETHRREDQKLDGLKAQTHFWGYSLKLPSRESENVSVKVDDAVDKSDDSQDVGPLQATRAWVTQAENNVIDRLVEAGLGAPLTPGGYENTVLDQIVINLQVPNNLAFTDQVRTRILLSTTIETTTVGNTILISKGLIDSLPNEESIASVVAMELAHIVMGHHIDTRYAFNDRLLFPDESTFRRIDMYHSDHDNAEAAKKAGINTGRVVTWVYMISGLCAGLGGFILIAQIGRLDQPFGSGEEFNVIAAAVLGGTSLFGGVGSAFGAVVGAVLVQMVQAGLVFNNVNLYLQPMIQGTIIFLAVFFDSLRGTRLALLKRRYIRAEA